MEIWSVIFLCLNIFSKTNAAGFDSNCVIPPLECPNPNVTFWLYTRANEKNPVQLKVSDGQTITSAPWVKGAPIKILLHGYTGYKDFSPNTELRPAYMECCDYNIISVDYHNVVLEPCYIQAAINTKLAGKCTAQLIDVLVQNYSIPLSRFHVIGFSLGAHTAGFIGNYLKSGKLSRITALDPALPLFATVNKTDRIDASDAIFVDVFHTNALMKGKLATCGDCDAYFNGGVQQPGCTTTKDHTRSGCEHTRAVNYFAESITTKTGFYATKCFSWFAYILGWCETYKYNEEEVLVGEYISKTVKGIYFCNTNSKPPYALGPTKNTVLLEIQNK